MGHLPEGYCDKEDDRCQIKMGRGGAVADEWRSGARYATDEGPVDRVILRKAIEEYVDEKAGSASAVDKTLTNRKRQAIPISPKSTPKKRAALVEMRPSTRGLFLVRLIFLSACRSM